MNNGAFGERFPYTNFHDLNLDWIIERVKKLTDDEEEQNRMITELYERIQPLEEWVENYDPSFISTIVETYLQENLARMIFVEITDSGYSVYHIPESWDTITFNTTGLDIVLELQPDYGHLVLSY